MEIGDEVDVNIKTGMRMERGIGTKYNLRSVLYLRKVKFGQLYPKSWTLQIPRHLMSLARSMTLRDTNMGELSPSFMLQ